MIVKYGDCVEIKLLDPVENDVEVKKAQELLIKTQEQISIDESNLMKDKN